MTRLLHITTTPISLDWLLGPQLDAFSSAGYEVVTASAPGPHARVLTDRGIAHHSMPAFTRNVDFRSDLRAASQVRMLLKELEPDILHTHNPKPGVIGRLVGRWTKVPIVVNTVHGLYAQRTDSFARRAAVYGAERIAATYSDAELVQNVEDLGTLRSLGVPEDRLHLLGNGIDLETFRPNAERSRSGRCLRVQLGIPLRTPIIGIVGRLVWEKGYREFFDAVELLRRSFGRDDVAFVVVGPAEERSTDGVDQATIARMHELFGVHFLGERNDVNSVLSAIDVFALPSHREGFPRAAMESSAMGVPVVATEIRGFRQVVDAGETGILVAPHDAGELAAALEKLVTQPILRDTMGRSARKKALAEFDQRDVIDTTLDVYATLLMGKGLDVPSQPLELDNAWYADSIDLVERDASNLSEASVAAADIDSRFS